MYLLCPRQYEYCLGVFADNVWSGMDNHAMKKTWDPHKHFNVMQFNVFGEALAMTDP